MSTLRYGKIERAIAAEIVRDARIDHSGKKGTVLIRSDMLMRYLYAPPDPVYGGSTWDSNWKPSPAEGRHQGDAFLRAQASAVRPDRRPGAPPAVPLRHRRSLERDVGKAQRRAAAAQSDRPRASRECPALRQRWATLIVAVLM
jgi:hypothetical protein